MALNAESILKINPDLLSANVGIMKVDKPKSKPTSHTVVRFKTDDDDDDDGIDLQKSHRRKLPKDLSDRESAVLVTDLCKGYVKHGPRVLNNFCMDVKKGTIYGLLGSSGCGKTTALSCIVGLKEWESGEILVFGQKPGTKGSGIPGKRLGYVPQDIALYDHLSIKENIQYYGRLYGMSEFAILEQWSLLVNLLQLPTEFKLVTNLSGGQKRRTSLALALVHHPELLILDEPTVGLDPLLRESVWKHLYMLVQTQGTSIIITTHYIEESRHSDTIGVMRHGRLLVEDSPAVLMEEHKTDLLEDVVLKLCWADTKKAMRHAPRASIFVNNNNADLLKDALAELDDGDSGTGTDDIDDGGRNSANSDDTGDSSVASSSSSNENAKNKKNKNGLKKTTSINPQAKNPLAVSRSKSSEISGALFKSKWKPELDQVSYDGDCSLIGTYHQSLEFDSFTPASFIGSESRPRGLIRKSSIQKPKEWLANAMSFCQHVAAFCVVIYWSMIRHPVFFLAALVLPAGEVLLTISSVGKDPKGLTMGIINDEMPDWKTNCTLDFIPIKPSRTNLSFGLSDDELECNFNELSCKYLGLLSQQGILDMIPYETTIEAEDAIRLGKLWGYVHFKNNYSQHMIDRLATKQFAFEESIEGSIISVKMDMSQYLGSVIILKHLFEGLQGYVQQLIDSCELGARQAEIPLHYRTPVYGSLDDSYNNFIIPGVLANIMFMMPFAISGLVFITDLKLGTLSRARVAGLTTVELMLAYCLTQGSMVIGQIVICTMCLKIGFDFQIVGSTLLYIGITLLLGMCGQAFGIFMGILCQDEIEALISALFILPTMLMFGGVLWPLDCMAPVWKYTGASLPTTLITESLRSVATRGVGITHSLLWPGIAVTSGWLIFFWVAALIAYRICVK